MSIKALGVFALLAFGGCAATPQQLADEGRLREAVEALDPDDPDDYDARQHVTAAVARATKAETVFHPLDDEELFAALGFVPERFASEELLLVYWCLASTTNALRALLVVADHAESARAFSRL